MAKKRISLIPLILIPGLLLFISAAAIYYISEYNHRPHFVRYPAFGIDIPEDYSIHGIDVSHHQDDINWDDVKAMQIKNIKIGFTFIKATEALGDVDDNFRRNWFEVKDAGLIRGAYHFFNAGKSGKAQAENFIETVQLKKGDLPPVLDIEQTNGASPLDIKLRAKDFLVMVENYYKVKPIIYTNVDFYENFLSDSFNNYPLWIAHYLVHDRPGIKRDWIFWQHNERGHVNGITSFVDFNVFNGDSAAFNQLLLK